MYYTYITVIDPHHHDQAEMYLSRFRDHPISDDPSLAKGCSKSQSRKDISGKTNFDIPIKLQKKNEGVMITCLYAENVITIWQKYKDDMFAISWLHEGGYGGVMVRMICLCWHNDKHIVIIWWGGGKMFTDYYTGSWLCSFRQPKVKHFKEGNHHYWNRNHHRPHG